MTTKAAYIPKRNGEEIVKQLCKNLNFRVIDIGASGSTWSRDITNTIVDIKPSNEYPENVTKFYFDVCWLASTSITNLIILLLNSSLILSVIFPIFNSSERQNLMCFGEVVFGIKSSLLVDISSK